MNLRASLLAAGILGHGITAAAQSTVVLPPLPAIAALPESNSMQRSDSGAVREAHTLDARIVFVAAMPAGVTVSAAMTASTIAGSGMQDTIPRRRAVAYSDWYSRRLTVHRYGSYAMLPLFVTQYVLGNKLLKQKEDLFAARRTIPVDKGLRTTHGIVAGAVGTLFVVNTTTGLWNLIEARNTQEGRGRRTLHAITMLAADAGFAYTGYLGSQTTDRGLPQGRKHRNVALTSFGISTAGAALMWFRQRD
ncbi:MAG: hypothetical protein H7Z40_04005 [Phycisphaerae bacterium]|nr:hypothetical protein [Gemmatimonadaceae bacterium]